MVYFKEVTDKEKNPKHPRLICHKATFYRRWNKFKATGILPPPDDYGISPGARPMLRDKHIPKLNNFLNQVIGLSENNSTLCKSIVAINQENKKQCNDNGYCKTPSASTVQLYQFLSCKEDESTHLIKNGNV